MKKIILLAAATLLCSTAAQAQFKLDDLSNKAKLVFGKSEALSQDEAAKGLRAALEQGVSKGTGLVSRLDGYFGNPEIKIPIPQDAKKVESKLRAIGMGSKVDEAVLALNRAAEDAAKEAMPIFMNAIRGMTIQDALSLVKGSERAGTDYLQRSSSDQLRTKFSPIIEQSLAKVNATKYWSDVMSTYNRIPFVEKVNPDLTAYVTDKAIEGLFVMVAKEEKNIRENPAARISDILKKVFGS